jgi:hypothetical protein
MISNKTSVLASPSPRLSQETSPQVQRPVILLASVRRLRGVLAEGEGVRPREVPRFLNDKQSLSRAFCMIAASLELPCFLVQC